jgi:hypothetical protein
MKPDYFELNLDRFITAQEMIINVQNQMGSIIQQLIRFFENLSFSFSKFDTNSKSAFRLTEQIIGLRSIMEELVQVYHKDKIVSIYLSFIKMIGFPVGGLKRAFKKLQLTNSKAPLINPEEINFKSLEIKHAKMSIVISTLDKNGNGVIDFASSNTKDVINVDACDLKDKNIDALMPKIYKTQHPKLVTNFFASSDKSQVKSTKFLVYLLDTNKNMQLAVSFVKIWPYFGKGVKMVF